MNKDDKNGMLRSTEQKREIEPGPLNSEKIKVPLTSLIVIYFLTWIIYFILFKEVRLANSFDKEKWYSFLVFSGPLVWFVTKYGLFIPLVLSIAYGLNNKNRDFLSFFAGLLIIGVVFTFISVSIDLVFDNRQVAIWKFYFVAIPATTIFAAIISRVVGRKFVFKWGV